MQVFKRILLVGLLLLLVAVVVSLFLPGTIQLERSIRIDASLNTIHPLVAEPGNWQQWSTWVAGDSVTDERDRKALSALCWEGKSAIVGKGCLTIMEVAHNTITTSHDHTITGGGRAEGVWIFEPVEKDVEDEEPAPEVYVTWKRSRDMTYLPVIGKLMGWSVKQHMAEEMEASLVKLKALSEAREEEKAPFVLVDLPMQRVLSIVDSCSIDGIGDKLRELYTELNVFVSLSNLEYGGQPMTIYHDWRPDENFTILEAAIPLMSESVIVSGRIQWRRMPQGPALMGSHYGLFSESDITHRRMDRWIQKEGLIKRASPWEVYITDPTTELDTMKWETRIYYPVEAP